MSFFKTYPPAPHLSLVVDYYWRSVISLSERLTQEVHTPLMQGMTFNLNRLREQMVFTDKTLDMTGHCYLFGQPTAHRLSLSNPQGIDILGVKFKAHGLYILTATDMAHLADDLVQAEDIWTKAEVTELCDAMYEAADTMAMIAILERFLLQKLSRNEHLTKDCRIAIAAQQMETASGFSLRDIHELTCFSERTLERQFKRQIGTSPKAYLRICRYNAVKARVDTDPSVSWADLIYSHGYYDQSHFIKEFKLFSGKIPGEYLAEKTQPSFF